MSDIVVTGGAGFLGGHLVNRLVMDGEDVCATYGYTPPHLQEKHNLHWFRCDVTDLEQCRKLIMQENPVTLYHLVAQPIVTAAVREPRLTLELSTRGTWNILDAVRQVGTNIKAIVFMSSDKVYGSNTNATEGSPMMGIDHPYNVAKVAADVIAHMYVESYKLPIVICRSANLYGPGDFHWDRLIPGISRDVCHGKRPVIRSNGQQKRDYIHVDDGVVGLRKMANYMLSGKIKSGSIFNFGSKRMWSVKEVVDLILKQAGRIDLIPEVLGGATDELDAQHIQYERAYEVLGWEPTVDMEDGIYSTYQWYKEWFHS